MCTLEKRGSLFILTLTGSGDDHRLSPAVLSSILSALAAVKSESSPGTALLTTASGSKFFSNGFDLAWAQQSSDFHSRFASMLESLRAVAAALIALPIPTVAALPGHAAAAGLALALAHDFVLMRSDHGVLYFSEVDIGLAISSAWAAFLRAKIGDSTVRRDVLLVGRKVRGGEAVAMGLAESAHDGAEKVREEGAKLAERLAARKWNGEIYAGIRMSVFPELSLILDSGHNTGFVPVAKL